MKLQLNYVHPTGKRVSTDGKIDTENSLSVDWIHSMVEANPDMNFFFTTDTTDI